MLAVTRSSSPLILSGGRKRSENFLRQIRGVRCIPEFGHQYDKFIITEARHRIRRADESAQPIREGLQKLIADKMRMGLVYGLKMVQIHKQHSKLLF